MSPAVWSMLGLIGAAIVTMVGGVYTARSARRTQSRAEDRNDFAALRETWRDENKGLRERLTGLEKAQADDRHIIATALRFISQITQQMRAGGLEPPPLPNELRERMREY